MHNINNTMVCDLPAGGQPQDAEGITLLGTEKGQGCVSHVVRLQVELIEGREELSYGTYGIIGNIDTITNTERDYLGIETGPQSGLRDFITSR